MTVTPNLAQPPDRYDPRWGRELVRELNAYFQRLLKGDVEAQATLASLAGRKIRPVLVTEPTYTVKLTEDLVDVNYAGAVALTLPANPGFGQRVQVQDSSGNASASNITIAPASGTVNGAATYVLATDYGRVTLIHNGTQWIAA